MIFDNLNAAQMVVAVLIFRYCDNNRKKESKLDGIKEHRLYSQYFMAYMIGKQILKGAGITLQEITHINFYEIKNYFNQNKELMYSRAEQNGYECTGALFEVYVTDPSQVTAEEELITEVYYPIRKI